MNSSQLAISRSEVEFLTPTPITPLLFSRSLLTSGEKSESPIVTGLGLCRRRVFGGSARFRRQALAQEGGRLDVPDQQARLIRVADLALDEDAQCGADMLGQGADDHHAVVAAVEARQDLVHVLYAGANAVPE